jgi:hypothetical protein
MRTLQTVPAQNIFVFDDQISTAYRSYAQVVRRLIDKVDER